MVKEHSLSTRNRAIGQLEAGKRQVEVASDLGISVRTIRRWWHRHASGDTLENKCGRGRKKKLSRVAKITIAKSLTKKGQSVRKLAARLTANGHPISHETVRKHMRETLKAMPYRPQMQPKLTEIQKKNRLIFCQERKKWSINDWRRVLFSDESTFELFHHPNRQTDRVWAYKKEQVAPTQKVKFPLKIHVWGVMSYRALSELHIIPRGQTVTANYYVETILKKCLTAAMHRSEDEGSVLERKLLPDMSQAIYQQDGAPAHSSRLAMSWLENNVDSFWAKGTWPSNSPDLYPIENL
jgi:transposase